MNENGPQHRQSVGSRGLMELVSTHLQRDGLFRQLVRSATERDTEIELIRSRYQLDFSYEEMHALSEAEAIGMPSYDELRKRVVQAYKELERRCDFVVCEGTDFVGAVPALDFGRNADLANELGAPVLVVVKGGAPEETVASVKAARSALEYKGCTIFGVIVNRLAPEHAGVVSGLLAELGL